MKNNKKHNKRAHNLVSRLAHKRKPKSRRHSKRNRTPLQKDIQVARRMAKERAAVEHEYMLLRHLRAVQPVEQTLSEFLEGKQSE